MQILTGTESIRKLEEDWKHVLREAPRQRRALHKRLAILGKRELDAAIASNGNPATPMSNPGRVQKWQEVCVGSGGGYMAVRPIKDKTAIGKSKRSAAALTAYAEFGHKTRISFTESGKARQAQKTRKAYVSGYHFYATARVSFEPVAMQEIDRFADEIAEKLGG